MAKRKPITTARRSQLDAVKVVKIMAGGVDIDTATAMAVPVIQSKPTKETRRRRTNAKRTALKALRTHKTPAHTLEALKLKPKKARKTAAGADRTSAKRRALSKMKQRRGLSGKLTKEEKTLLKKYSAAQTFRGRATPATYLRRANTLQGAYSSPAPEDMEQILDDLEWMTPAEIAKKYGLKKLRKTGTEPPDVWRRFTDCSEEEERGISFEELRSAAPWISNAEYEDPKSKGHESQYFLYNNNFLEKKPSLFDLDKGQFENLEVMRSQVVSDIFGNTYIYVHSPSTNRGRILLRSEYENARTLAPDWIDSLLYIPLGVD